MPLRARFGGDRPSTTNHILPTIAEHRNRIVAAYRQIVLNNQPESHNNRITSKCIQLVNVPTKDLVNLMVICIIYLLVLCVNSYYEIRDTLLLVQIKNVITDTDFTGFTGPFSPQLVHDAHFVHNITQTLRTVNVTKIGPASKLFDFNA